MEIPFRGQIDLAVLRRMNRLVLAPRRGFRIAGLIVALLMLWALVIDPLVRGRFEDEIVPLILLLAVVGWFAWSLFYQGPRKLLESSKLMQEPISGLVTESGVRMETPLSHAELPWDVFFKAQIGKDMVLLYQSLQVYNALPREFFASDADWQAFVEQVRQRVPLKDPQTQGVSAGRISTLLLWVAIFIVIVLLWVTFGDSAG